MNAPAAPSPQPRDETLPGKNARKRFEPVLIPGNRLARATAPPGKAETPPHACPSPEAPSQSKPPDPDAARRIAFVEKAIEHHGNAVLRLAYARTRNKADAEDVFQTVYLKLCECDTAFADENHLKAWLLRVAANCCIDMQRSGHRAKRADADPESMAASDETAAQGNERLEAALDALPEKQRIAVHLFYYENKTGREIASIMGEKPSTVRSHLRRARIRLEALMGERHEQ